MSGPRNLPDRWLAGLVLAVCAVRRRTRGGAVRAKPARCLGSSGADRGEWGRTGNAVCIAAWKISVGLCDRAGALRGRAVCRVPIQPPRLSPLRSDRIVNGDRPQVVITGIGMVTGLGAGRETTWQSLLAGAGAVRWLDCADLLERLGAKAVLKDLPRFAGRRRQSARRFPRTLISRNRTFSWR